MRRLLLLVGAIVFVDTMFFAALTPLLPHYAHDLHLSKAGAGALAAAYPAGAFVAGLPAGLLAARAGVRPTVLIGLVGMAVTTVVFGFADAYWLLLAARFVQGAASSCSWTGGLAWLVVEAPASRRGELIGAALGAAIFGALFGPVLGTVASAVGTGPAFAAVAALAVVLVLWTLATPAHRPAERQPLRLLFAALRDRAVVVAAWFVLLPALGFGVLGVLAPLHLAALGFGAAAVGATFLVSAGVEALLSPVVGRLSDRRGRLLPLRAGLAGGVVVTAVLAFADERWLLAACVLVAAASFGTFWAPSMSLLADRAEELGLNQSYGFALVNLAWAPGAAVGGAAR